jgi:hypothetical protein
MEIDEDWHEFTRSFALAIRPDDTQGRSTKRMIIIGCATVFALALAVVGYGAITAPGGDGGTSTVGTTAEPGVSGAETVPTVSLPSTGGVAAATPAVPTWAAVAGPTCSNSATSFSETGYYTATGGGQPTGWITSAIGGYSGSGCTGGFVSVPLSGKSSVYDTSRYALWTFHLSAKYVGGSCALSAFIPGYRDVAYVGGDPAYYLYYGTPYSPSVQALGGFSINQRSMRGQWVAGGSLKASTSSVSVKMVDAGTNTTSSTMNAHAVAAQMRLTCHAAS